MSKADNDTPPETDNDNDQRLYKHAGRALLFLLYAFGTGAVASALRGWFDLLQFLGWWSP